MLAKSGKPQPVEFLPRKLPSRNNVLNRAQASIATQHRPVNHQPLLTCL